MTLTMAVIKTISIIGLVLEIILFLTSNVTSEDKEVCLGGLAAAILNTFALIYVIMR